MLTLIGLGNPGRKYVSTRHNAGKMLAAYLRRHPAEGLEILKTDCYMNRSGEFVKKTVEQCNSKTVISKSVIGSPVSQSTGLPAYRSTDYRFTVLPFHRSTDSTPIFPNLIIAHDDLDLKLGEWKIHFGRGPRLHKGILSIEQALGTKDFWRVRIGVDNREPNSEFRIQNSEFLRPSGEDYVLRPFRREEKIILNRTFGLIKQTLLTQFTKNTRSRIFSESMRYQN